MLLGALSHQDLPFEQLIEALEPPRDTSRTPLFQVSFAFQSSPTGQRDFSDLTLEDWPLETTVAKFDLTLALSQRDGELGGVLEYNTDLFDETTMRALLGHYHQLLQGFAGKRDAIVGRLPMLLETERQTVLQTFNDTAHAFPEQSCVHELFFARAAERPDAVAMIGEGQHIRYGELAARADRLAGYLRMHGAGPEVFVGLMIGRSLDLIVGLLAILRSGAAYVPLDPEYPADRLEAMAEQCPLVLSREVDRQELRETRTILIDREAAAIAACRHSVPVPAGPVTRSAYAIYTSGSTGKPKGVPVGHRPLTNQIAWFVSTFGLVAEDRLLLKTSLSFDASVWEWAAPLASGGSLVIAPPGVQREPETLLALLEDHEITLLQVVPTLLTALLDADRGQFAGLRHLFCGGEALDERTRDRVNALGVPLTNLYGPTETTVQATWWTSWPGEETPVAIGRPVWNMQGLVLDAFGEPVPIGVQGELHLGGMGVSRGYLDNPRLTAERFLPAPAGERIYQTGDLVRWTADGNLIFCGRRGQQVKLRGFRIELGEIEAALTRTGEVARAAVLLREDLPGGQGLVGYVQPGEGASGNLVERLRGALGESLPAYMIPAVFVLLERFPQTPNGKLDRKALPAPVLGEDTAARSPRGPLEEIIAGIWSEVLGRPVQGPEDNFFELGGHSLSATQIVSRLRETFETDLTLSHFFAAPTIAAQAGLVRDLRGHEGGHQLAPPGPAPADAEIPLSFTQSVMWMAIRMEESRATQFNMPYVTRLEGALDPVAIGRALTDIVARHAVLRTRFQNVDGRLVQTISAEAAFSPVLVDLRRLEDREDIARRLITRDAGLPIDPDGEPLFRVTLMRLDDEVWVLSCTMLHLISDGWSLSLWAHELATLYTAHLEGASAPLDPLPIQYGDYAWWQHHVLTGPELDRQLAYWQQQLRGIPELLSLPLDHPRPEIATNRGAQHLFEIGADLTDGLKALARTHATTPFVVLEAAFAILLQRYSGQDDVVIGTNIANRHHQQLEPLIGLFTTVQAMRCNLSGDPELPDLLRRLGREAIEAHENQDVPFERLLDALEVTPNLSYAPVFQVMLVLQNTPEESLHLPGLQVDAVSVDFPFTKYDLSLFIVETPHCMRAGLEYKTDLFVPETIAEMADRLHHLLEDMVRDPRQPISAFTMVAEETFQLAGFMESFDDD